jgi:hypothetical protein
MEGAACPHGLVCSVRNMAEADPVVHLASLPRLHAWSIRAMQPPTMLNIGRAPWLDAHKSRGLVDEVIYAAGGMERELMVSKEIVSVAQQIFDTYNIGPPKDSLVTPKVGMDAAHHASYTLVNALTWARSVKDRVERHCRR